MADEPRPLRPSLRPLDYVFLLRPTALVPLWIFLLAGVRAGALASGETLPLIGVTGVSLVAILAMTMVLAGGYILNQIVDRETDRLNRKLFFLSDGIISERAAWSEMWALWAGAVALSFLTPPLFRAVLVVSLLLSATYSAPPFKIKARPFLDLLWNGVGFGAVAFAAGWSSMAIPESGVYVRALSYALSVAGIIASTTIPDIEGDARSGLRTTGVLLGESRTSVLAIALLGLGALSGWAAHDLLGLLGPLLSLPLLVRAHLTGQRPHRTIANQVSVVVFALVVGVTAPVLLALLALVYFGSRAYYRARFGIAFPGRGTP